MDKLYERLSEFGEREHSVLLRNLLNTAIRDATTGNREEKRVAEKVYQLLEAHMETVYNDRLQAEKLQTHVHIVFSLSDAGSLKVTLSKLGKRQECNVLAFNEHFSAGPITDLITMKGQQHRQLWLMDHDQDYYSESIVNREHQIECMMDRLRKIPESKTVVIWCGDNAHDQTGFRFALYLLRERKGPVHVVNVTQIHKNMGLHLEKGVIPYAQALIERENYIELVRNYGEGYPLDPDQRKLYESEWTELSSQDHIIRLWEGGKVIGCEEDILDAVIVNSVNELQKERMHDDFIKAGEVVTKVLEISQQYVGYSFIVYRIWRLVSDGVLTFQGIPGMLHKFSIRLSNSIKVESD
ncbi:hypothetical protein GCM10010912_39850 [Paenibacillus albidus]|uniref:DUF1835 domain-containing protein n=1 Tax=Paenibacillus albidus TaxID=2041023 RepID=A0A917FM01_9BACL|nr:DUF1835 domain-containing protein [Paenibacillus albidus]GGF90778.1 hypothetical protein GCM10010912_39850 [Paenibacillus albidus]